MITSTHIKIREAAVLAGITRRGIWMWIRDGKLTARKVKGITRVATADVLRLKTRGRL